MAKTVVHELMHVINHASRNFDGERRFMGVDRHRAYEPYFADEAECEYVLSVPASFWNSVF